MLTFEDKENKMSSFGFALKYMRESRKLSLRELSLLSDIDHSYIYRIEVGTRKKISELTLKKLKKALKLSKNQIDVLKWLSVYEEVDEKVIKSMMNKEEINLKSFMVVSIIWNKNMDIDPLELMEKVEKLTSSL